MSRWFMMLWCGGKKLTPRRRMVHPVILALQYSSKYMRYVDCVRKLGESDCTLSVTLSHAYIDEEADNCLWVLRCDSLKPLEMILVCLCATICTWLHAHLHDNFLWVMWVLALLGHLYWDLCRSGTVALEVK